MGDWRRVYDAVAAEKRKRRVSWRIIYTETDLSEPTFNRMRDGLELGRQETRDKLEQGMGWEPGSLEVILAGGEPIKRQETPGGSPDTGPLLRELLAEVRGLRHSTNELRGHIEALEAQLGVQARRSPNAEHESP